MSKLGADSVISPHSTEMPKGLYFTVLPLWFSFFLLFMPNVWGHWTDLNQLWTHIHLWLLFEKNLVQTFPGHLPLTGWGQKTLFWPTLNFDRTYLCNRTWYQQSERNLSTYRDSPTCRQIWWTLVQKRQRTVGKFLPTPAKFSHCQLYLMDVI